MSESENYQDYKDAERSQRQDYGKAGAHLMNTREDKVESESRGTAVGAGGGSGQNNGPTGSKRDYGKSGREGRAPGDKTDWLPIKKAPSTYGICGV